MTEHRREKILDWFGGVGDFIFRLIGAWLIALWPSPRKKKKKKKRKRKKKSNRKKDRARYTQGKEPSDKKHHADTGQKPVTNNAETGQTEKHHANTSQKPVKHHAETMHGDQPEGVLIQKEAAKYLGCSTSTVYRATKSGELKSLGKIGREAAYTKQELDAYLDGKKRVTTDADDQRDEPDLEDPGGDTGLEPNLNKEAMQRKTELDKRKGRY